MQGEHNPQNVLHEIFCRKSILFWVVAAALLLGVGAYVGFQSRASSSIPPSSLHAYSEQNSAAPLIERSGESPSPQVVPEQRLPRVAIVIDDMGANNLHVAELLAVQGPLTFAVLPFTPFARSIASRVHQSGREVMVHLPMEPTELNSRMDPGMLMMFMTPEVLVNHIQEAINAVPFAVGVNNHKGSAMTEDPRLMEIILKEVKARGMFFVDSRTTPRSVGFQMARDLGLPSATRRVFLDNSHDPSYIHGQLDLLLQTARRKGSSLGIGHPSRSTVSVLKERVPRFYSEGVRLVPVSEILE